MLPLGLDHASLIVECEQQNDRVPLRELCLPLTHLRQMLQAVESAKPAQEDQHHGPAAQIRKADRLAGQVRQGKVRGRIARLQRHARVIRAQRGSKPAWR